MKAVTWQGTGDVRVEEVPDPTIVDPTDAIVRITTTGLCGSDLHLLEPLAPFMTPGDVLGHEPMGMVEEVGPEVTELAPGDRVVVPFNISCGTCWMCSQGLHSQCETTQNRDYGTGASLFGYSSLYGAVPGGQAEYLRVPFGNTLPIKVPEGPPDDRFVLLSDVLPTAWQGVRYAGLPEDGVLLVVGAGPMGDMAARIALARGPPGDRRRPGAGAAGPGGGARGGHDRPRCRRRRGRGGARPHWWPRGRRSHRRGRHGGARKPVDAGCS